MNYYSKGTGRDNHYIPQFLLSGWCNTSDCLTVYSRPNKHVVTSQRNPKSTAFETNLYSYENVPPERQHVIETEFFTPHIDTPAASILKKILEGGFADITTDERSDFSRFVLSLRARNPGAIELARTKGMQEISSQLGRDNHEYEAVKSATSPDTLIEYVRLNLPALIPNFGISIVPKVITNPEVGERIFHMPWFLHSFNDTSLDLLLSDRPCILKGNALEGMCIIALPLSPRHLLFISNNEVEMQHLRSMSPSKVVKLVNKESVIHAVSRIYGTGQQHLGFVEKYLSK